MNWFEKWMLIRTIKKIVKQGNQYTKISALYHMILTLSRAEYTEDNDMTLKMFLTDCFNNGLKEDNEHCKKN